MPPDLLARLLASSLGLIILLGFIAWVGMFMRRASSSQQRALDSVDESLRLARESNALAQQMLENQHHEIEQQQRMIELLETIAKRSSFL